MTTDKASGWVIGLAAAAGLSIGLSGCGKSPSGSEVAPASATGDEASASSEAVRPAVPPVEAVPAELLEQMPSLERVLQALDGAPVNISIERGEQLARARAWLEENPGDMSPREREMMAQMLVIIDDLLESDDVSLARMVGMGESQLLQLWAMDADGDGALSDEEASMSMQRMMELQQTMADYNKDRFDDDGDGTVSPEEAAGMGEAMMQNMQPLFSTMMKRAGLVNWDSNADGSLSAEERQAGEATLNMMDWDQDGQFNDMERLAGYSSILQDFSNGLVLLEQPDTAALQAEMQARVMEQMEMAQSGQPSIENFDADGDGVYSDEENAAFQAESEVYQAQMAAMSAEMQQAGENMMTQMLRMQYDIAINRLDQNADGLLMNEEWEAGYSGLRGERDRRMFNYLYDVDRSGGVAEAEVARFMDAYDARSPYADADLDGKVDTNDLQAFMVQVTSQ